MVKNYLTVLLGKVKQGPEFLPCGSNFEDKYDIYQDMSKLLVSSAEMHLQKIDEIIYIGGEFEHTSELFKNAFLYNYELWNKEKCNILTSEVDCLFVKESNIFEEYKDFSLFGRNPGPNVCPECGPISVNSMRYFPHTTEKEIMDYGYELFKGDNLESHSKTWQKEWDAEMGIYNKMFFKQRDGFYTQEQNLREHLSRSSCYWHLMNGGSLKSTYNYDCDIDDAKVLAFSGTRGQQFILSEMKWYNNKFNKIKK
tara:strand:- start:1704 stop:2465 length:762 start_codon:yes stop_codon:yes gene_type:complete